MFGDVEIYTQAVNLIGNDLSKYALGTAMAGVGLSTSASSLKGVGWKPFAVGGAGALVVGGTGFTVATPLIKCYIISSGINSMFSCYDWYVGNTYRMVMVGSPAIPGRVVYVPVTVDCSYLGKVILIV
jgi:hypothetical protein